MLGEDDVLSNPTKTSKSKVKDLKKPGKVDGRGSKSRAEFLSTDLQQRCDNPRGKLYGKDFIPSNKRQLFRTAESTVLAAPCVTEPSEKKKKKNPVINEPKSLQGNSTGV